MPVINNTMETEDTGTLQAQPDFLDAPIAVPAGKLDADQYAADDLDGVTESLFGSGNMAHATLQASQADAALALGDGFALGGDALLPGDETGTQNAFPPGSGDASVSGFSPGAGTGSATDTDRPLDFSDDPARESPGAEGHFTNAAIGSLGASALRSDGASFASSSDFRSGGDLLESDTVNNNTTNQTTVNENGVTNNVTQNSLVDLGDSIEQITNLGDEIVNTVIEGDIGDAVTLVTNEISEITDIVNNEISNLTEAVTNIFEDPSITNITEQVTNVVNEITNEVTTITNEVTNAVTNIVQEAIGGPVTIDLTDDLLNSLSSGLHMTIDDSVAGTLDTDLASNNLLALAEDLTGLSVPLAADGGAAVSFDLLGGGSVDDGNDLTIAGLDAPDIDLGPIEDIAGDIDIEITPPLDLLDPATLTDAIGGTLEGLGGLGPASADEIPEILGDQGLDGALDIVAGDTVLGEDFDITADSLADQAGGLAETLPGMTEILDTGALGQPVDIAAALPEITDSSGLLEDLIETVADTADPLTDALGVDNPVDASLLEGVEDSLDIEDAIGLLAGSNSGGADEIAAPLSEIGSESAWTESIIVEDTVGTLGGIADGLAGSLDILPEPSGTIAEGLGVLDTAPDTQHIGLGGLFG